MEVLLIQPSDYVCESFFDVMCVFFYVHLFTFV